MKKYLKPMLDVVLLDDVDVVLASGGSYDPAQNEYISKDRRW